MSTPTINGQKIENPVAAKALERVEKETLFAALQNSNGFFSEKELVNILNLAWDETPEAEAEGVKTINKQDQKWHQDINGLTVEEFHAVAEELRKISTNDKVKISSNLWKKDLNKLVINYGEMPGSCRNTDTQCNENMLIGSFLMALDYVTSRQMDGEITASQIETLIAGGEFSKKYIMQIGYEFNDKAPNGLQLSAAPMARGIKLFLRDNHKDIYEALFGVVKSKPADTKEAKELVSDNLLKLVRILERVLAGEEVEIDQRKFFVDLYTNGFGVKIALDLLFVDEIGGKEMADECQRVLNEAMGKLLAEDKEDSGPCDKVLPGGVVDNSGCYQNTADSLRQLIKLLK